MPPDRRTLRDIRQAYKGMRQYQRNVGQWVEWFRFNKAGTSVDPVYDVGPQRAWYPAIPVPVHIAEHERAERNVDSDGLYLVDKLHLVINYDAFFHSTMPDPDLTGKNHYADRVGFDGQLYQVMGFYPRGRVASHFLTISVDCNELSQEDMIEDVNNGTFTGYGVAT